MDTALIASLTFMLAEKEILYLEPVSSDLSKLLISVVCLPLNLLIHIVYVLHPLDSFYIVNFLISFSDLYSEVND